MIRIDERIVKLLEKIKLYIQEEKMDAGNFPMDSIFQIMEDTIGEAFWKCIGSEKNPAFAKTVKIYKECLKEALVQNDMKACYRILDLFENSYQALYSVISEDERLFRQKPYRKMIIDMGNAYAQVQWRLHKERQKEMQRADRYTLTEGKGVVYTCQFGEEVLYQPSDVEPYVDYICFTNQEEKWGTREGIWQFQKMKNPEELSEKLLKTKYKILAHELLKEYDYSIWVDNCMMIVSGVLRFCEVYGENNSFLSFPQSKEDCLYQDISYMHMATDEMNISTRKKIHQYKKEGYPEYNGLIDSRVMVRNHRDSLLQKVMSDWWKETQNAYMFGKNAFNYVAWKNNFPFSICDLFLYQNPYFVNKEVELELNEDT